MRRLGLWALLAHDVLRLTWRRRHFGALLVAGGLATLGAVCGVDIERSAVGYRLSFFGAEVLPPRPGDPRVVPLAQALALVHVLFVRAGLAASFGIALGLLVCADAVPRAFGPGRAELLLSRPLGVGDVVVGRFLGALAFALVHSLWVSVLLFVGFGLRLGLWHPPLLLLGPTLLPKFAVLLSLCASAAVLARSLLLGIACAGLAWACSFGVNMLEHAAHEGPLASLEDVARWAQRLFPQVAHQDAFAAWTCAQDPPVSDLAGLALQALVWTALPLVAAALVAARRDH
ncbi:MAG: hypothetical protein D6731_14960 [Planctomycetota bacterium]|nr:MAG: hypothetical protein D6731_14960 [Planctomycetota bacterium]